MNIKNLSSNTIIILISVIVLGALFAYIIATDSSSTSKVPDGKYDQFAQCLKDKGATFYGAFWCSHCKEQKELFGKTAVKVLPYVECSTPDGTAQTSQCKEDGITGYPTWKFSDGEIIKGNMSLAQLSEKTSCVLPE
jgi:hypothetical protein